MKKKQYYVTWKHKIEDIYINIAKDVETRFYELERLLPRGKNKKVIGLVKDEFYGKVMTELAALRLKTYSYLRDANDGS